jgi:transcriptional regulator GlxA family with amidase domain
MGFVPRDFDPHEPSWTRCPELESGRRGICRWISAILRGVLRNVAVVVTDKVAAFELGVICEVFGIDRIADGFPAYDFAVCAAEPPPLRCDSGFVIQPAHGLERLASADLIAVPAWRDINEQPPEELLEALRAAVHRGARVMSVCTGAFVLAAAGLLDGRRASTHWRYAAALAAKYPRAMVDPNVLYVDAGDVLTSAGTAAGIDLCLHIVRTEHGAGVANALARRMVVPPHRDGGQAQYVETPVRQHRRGDELSEVLDWASGRLDEPLCVDELAARALMSTRTFARRFRAVTGTTPHRWLQQQRLLLAQQLLEDSDEPIEEVARLSGFGSAVTLRQQFQRWRGTSPQSYRRTFYVRASSVA